MVPGGARTFSCAHGTPRGTRRFSTMARYPFLNSGYSFAEFLYLDASRLASAWNAVLSSFGLARAARSVFSATEAPFPTPIFSRRFSAMARNPFWNSGYSFVDFLYFGAVRLASAWNAASSSFGSASRARSAFSAVPRRPGPAAAAAAAAAVDFPPPDPEGNPLLLLLVTFRPVLALTLLKPPPLLLLEPVLFRPPEVVLLKPLLPEPMLFRPLLP